VSHKDFFIKTITYDATGNPLSDGTWNYSWEEGRKLASMSHGSSAWTFTYDANGMRIRRANGSAIYNYTYHGSRLSHMTYGNNELHFYYDASGRPLSVVYNGTTYYYVLNLQGDVVAILDTTGAEVVGYSYDAWGNPLDTTGSMKLSLGLYNPLRYRGYVYDQETGLYYLQSRYYDPETGRFINADDTDYLGASGTVLGYNLFAYCENNPVNCSDPTGTDAIWLQDLDAVWNMGHTGLLLQDSSGVWFHFYWGNNRSKVKGKKGPGNPIQRYSGELNLSSINLLYNKIRGGSYERMIYFEGDFSNSLRYARAVQNNWYNLVNNNCMQLSTDILRHGTFAKNNFGMKLMLLSVRRKIVPNIAFMKICPYYVFSYIACN
jgi:RHS repeat-associated protein